MGKLVGKYKRYFSNHSQSIKGPQCNEFLSCPGGQTSLNDLPFTYFVVDHKLHIVQSLKEHLSTLKPIHGLSVCVCV